MVFIYFKQRAAYELLRSVMGSVMCKRGRHDKDRGSDKAQENNEGVLGEGFAF